MLPVGIGCCCVLKFISLFIRNFIKCGTIDSTCDTVDFFELRLFRAGDTSRAFDVQALASSSDFHPFLRQLLLLTFQCITPGE